MRYTATGDLDPDFGTGGVVSRVMTLTLGDGPAELLRAPRGGDIVVGPFAPASTLETPVLRAARVTTAGRIVASAADVPLVFGGGTTTAGPMRDETSVRQNAFVPGRALARADGSLVIPGATGVVEHTDRGPSNSHLRGRGGGHDARVCPGPVLRWRGPAADDRGPRDARAPGDRRRRDRADLGAQACACCA